MDNMTLGAAQALAKKLGADPELVTAAVEAWLDAHPEATTTVEDGSITKAKLDQILQGIVDDVPELKSAVTSLEGAVDELESGSLSALGASEGQVPIADGEGEWAWGDAPGGGGTVTDVQVNGVSVLSQGVANVPMAGGSTPGVIQVGDGLFVNAAGKLVTNTAGTATIKAGIDAFRPIPASGQHTSTFYGLAKAAGADMASISSTTVGTYPEAQKSAISTMLNGSVSVTGTTPSITALPGIRYICGEVATLDITIPVSGIVDIVFESGSTPTVLTATGVTWPAWFDATALEANTTYEISIADGYGAVMTWA